MKLGELLSPWVQEQLPDCSILNLQNDSRLIKAGDLFLAYPGASVDGRSFIERAILQGAVAVVYEEAGFHPSKSSVPMIGMSNVSEKLAFIASRFYHHPSQALRLTGITGTNGKTTVAYQLAQAHQNLGQKSAYIGTIGQGEVSNLSLLNNTTPDALALQRLLANYRDRAIAEVVMEVSSHALCQARVEALSFEQAIFTNLSLDHLDYHKTMAQYAAAKARLFTKEGLKWSIINQDDDYAAFMAADIRPEVRQVTYGIEKACDIKAIDWQTDVHGSSIHIKAFDATYHIKTKTLGLFNVYNSLAVFASLLVSGYSPNAVVEAMSLLNAAPGRMERVGVSKTVFVDYAHTPDALEKALATLYQLKKGRLWVVFGCGGDRDKTKRPLMGQAASRYADHMIITSDNPRSEAPKLIIDEIAAGVEGHKYTKLVHREEAIAYALARLESDDILLIAGKGHEAYQQIGDVKHPFSDQEVVHRLVNGSLNES